MKFTYDTKQDDRECVAMLLDNGPSPKLVIKCDEGWLCLYGEDHFTPNVWQDDDPENYPVIKRFYKGDTVALEF